MAIRKVARMGHPILRQSARELKVEELQSPEFKRLVQDMIDTMAEYGGIGLAAPQIHESVKVAILGFGEDNERYPGMGEQPLTVLVNPKVTPLTEERQGFWEGCLSVPGLRGLVYRPKKIRVDYIDMTGAQQSVEAEGFAATVFQHELDHLDGVLFVDRIEQGLGSTRLAFQEEYERYSVPQEGDEVGELAD